MFERLTDLGRRVVVLAQEEARQLNHNYVGTEHLLLGLVTAEGGNTAEVLLGLGLTRDKLRAKIRELIGAGAQQPSGHIPFTPRAKRALETARREALALGHDFIGTEHLLLGLLDDGESEAFRLIVSLDVDVRVVARMATDLLPAAQSQAKPTTDKIVVTPQRQRDPYVLRREALQLAIEAAGTGVPHEQLVKAAQAFEKYLSGGESE